MNKFYWIKNFNKPKILIYTDSRGFNVLNKLGKNYFDSYIFDLIKKYRVSAYICLHKFTTILDFIEFYEKKAKHEKYDAIICHCGVVDFSPRPLSSLKLLKQTKNSPYFKDIFESLNDYYSFPFETKYRNEPTINLYSKSFLESNIATKLNEIDNLIWIDSNQILNNWNGNYLKGRPENINTIVSEYDKIMNSKLKNKVSLRDWSEKEIKEFTIDNIHFTNKGFHVLNKRIEEKLAHVLSGYDD